MAQLGINVDGRGGVHPDDIVRLGATVARCVAYPDVDISSWIKRCHAKGIKILLVLAHESIGGDPRYWAQNIAMFRDRYPGLIDSTQLGNEPDHVSPSSWTMSQAGLSQLLQVGRNVLGQDAYIVGAGLVSGNPDWASGADWRPVSALACHPYAKQPGSPELDWLLGRYAAYGRPLWVTEYHARSIGMAAALRDDPRLEAALAFCYSDSMVPGFGLIEDPAALADYTAAASGGQPVPVDRFVVGQGMRDLMAKHHDFPASDEVYFKGYGGRDAFSEAVAGSGRMYRFVPATGKTFSYPPEDT